MWFTIGKWQPPNPQKPPDRIRVSIPEGWTFEDAARTIVKVDKSLAAFHGFRREQLRVKMRAIELDERDAQDALQKLLYGAHDGVPQYIVKVKNGVYYISTVEPSHVSQ